MKDGGWVKRKTGRHFPRKFHVNLKKLLPAARAYIFAKRKMGIPIDITNYLLNFYRFKSQR